jgi:hypothetical protein
MTLSTAKSEAHCFRFWFYKTPQRCGARAHGPQKQPVPVLLPPERTEVNLPSLDFIACPEGDERLLGIARLRALSDVPATDGR